MSFCMCTLDIMASTNFPPEMNFRPDELPRHAFWVSSSSRDVLTLENEYRCTSLIKHAVKSNPRTSGSQQDQQMDVDKSCIRRTGRTTPAYMSTRLEPDRRKNSPRRDVERRGVLMYVFHNQSTRCCRLPRLYRSRYIRSLCCSLLYFGRMYMYFNAVRAT